MDYYNSMRHFVEVVRASGFTPAASKLGLSRAQLSKSVMQLEAHLGVRLLNRTTRSISLTEIGAAYFERCLSILDDIDELEASTREQIKIPRGKLSISAPTSFGILHLQHALRDYLQRYSEVQINLSLSDRFVDVVEEGFDVVIRIAELEDSNLIARRIAPCKRVFCASPQYLKTHGYPKVPQDLSLHTCLIYCNEQKPEQWQLHGPNGVESVQVHGPVCADNGDVLKAAALDHMGITLLPTFIVGTDLQTGRLVQVLDAYCPPDLAIYAVFASRRYLSAKVKTFIDHLQHGYGDHPYWDLFK